MSWMREIRIHARAGQGAITTGEVLANAAFREGKWALAFPHFGAARMGAAMNAFVRLADEPVRLRTQIYQPDALLIVDPSLMYSYDVFAGLKPNGIVIVNQPTDQPVPYESNGVKIFCVPADDIAEKAIGRRLGNTTMVGAYAAASGDFQLASLEAVIDEHMAKRNPEGNKDAARQGYELISSSVP